MQLKGELEKGGAKMATSSITANFEIRDPKAYLPSEASFAKQSVYSSARAFVDGLWKAYRTRPPRRPKNVQFVSVTDATPWEVCFNVACPCLIKGGLK